MKCMNGLSHPNHVVQRLNFSRSWNVPICLKPRWAELALFSVLVRYLMRCTGWWHPMKLSELVPAVDGGSVAQSAGQQAGTGRPTTVTIACVEPPFNFNLYPGIIKLFLFKIKTFYFSCSTGLCYKYMMMPSITAGTAALLKSPFLPSTKSNINFMEQTPAGEYIIAINHSM